MTRDDIPIFLRTHKQEMQLNYGVAVVGLFGRYARQAARDDSDIDILVEFQAEKKPCGISSGLSDILKKTLESTSILASRAR